MVKSKPLFGDIAKTISFNEIILSKTIYPPFARLPEHSHDFAYFCLVLNGSYTEKLNGKEQYCSPSALIFHAQKNSHSDEFHQAGGLCFNIQFKDSLINRVSQYAKTPERSKIFNDLLSIRHARKLYDEFMSPDDFSPMVIEGITLEMFANILRQDTKPEALPKWLVMTKDLLHGQFREPLNLNYIAGAVGRHPVHLAREFRRNFQCTIGEYVRRLRIDFAIRELSESRHSISEIALSAGFSQQSHFTRTFKLITGKTPNEFRQSSLPR